MKGYVWGILLVAILIGIGGFLWPTNQQRDIAQRDVATIQFEGNTLYEKTTEEGAYRIPVSVEDPVTLLEPCMENRNLMSGSLSTIEEIFQAMKGCCLISSDSVNIHMAQGNVYLKIVADAEINIEEVSDLNGPITDCSVIENQSQGNQIEISIQCENNVRINVRCDGLNDISETFF